MTVLGFTRPSKRLKDSVKEAEDMGFTVYAAPSLEILPGEDQQFARFEESVTPESIVVFCSSTAVEECQTRYGDRLPGIVGDAKVVSIGPATTGKLEAVGITPSAVPEDYSSYGIVDMMRDEVGGKRVILVRSDSGSDVLSDGMMDAGAELVDIAAYRLKEAGMGNALLHMMMELKSGRIDVMAFTSPMSASMFIAAVEKQFGKERGDEYLHSVKVAAIGIPTKKRLTELGFAPDIVPEKTTFTDMLKAIRAEFPE
ncbi:uroporphyrinogen-III synthase [Candidatus Methanoprimaticola sp. MG2]|uniref:uroporphyrinogen-III synthase n=1 Tax=Candidatus Methanoprimaticola sp. MG2 TaxID=3228838 RepID=UPI0039C6AE08